MSKLLLLLPLRSGIPSPEPINPVPTPECAGTDPAAPPRTPPVVLRDSGKRFCVVSFDLRHVQQLPMVVLLVWTAAASVEQQWMCQNVE